MSNNDDWYSKIYNDAQTSLFKGDFAVSKEHWDETLAIIYNFEKGNNKDEYVDVDNEKIYIFIVKLAAGLYKSEKRIAELEAQVAELSGNNSGDTPHPDDR